MPFGVSSRRSAALLWVFLVVSACGKVGDPQPPFIRIPEAVKDLAASQSGHNIVLSWTNPPRNIDGSAATNLAHVQIRSNDAPFATVDVTATGKPQSYPIPIAAGANATRTFSLTVDTTQGKLSMVSNSASITPVEVPGRVTKLKAFADQRRVIVQWEKPEEHPELADAYIVTRADTPAESETVTNTRYEDPDYQPRKTFTYNVTPIRRVSGVIVAGVGPESYQVTVEDKTPPQVPMNLDIKVAVMSAFLTWDPNEEADLAGYRVYRSERADGGFTSVTDRLITGNSFVDSSYRAGTYYAVSAVDESQNESPRSAPFRGP
jgi:fibronectin type 3 domain-containing protein